MVSIVRPNRHKPVSPSRRSRNRPAVFLLFAVVMVGCGLGIYESTRRAMAESWIATPTLESLEKAVRLTPTNGAGWVSLGRALALSGGGQERAIEAIRKGVALGPYNPEAWIHLALQVESRGDTKVAEQHLLKAFSVDKGFDSSWQLANFYLRHGQTDEFWRWIRQTISIAPRGFEPGIQLCWRAFDDPQLILDRAIPDDPDINRRYFYFTRALGLAEGRAAVGVWERIKGDLRSDDVEGVKWLITHWQRNGRPSEAVDVRNRASAAGVIPYAPLSLSGGDLITNGRLAHLPTGEAFDWKLTSSEDVRPEIEAGGQLGAGFAFHFSGTQSAASTLLEQIVPVNPGEDYRFDYRYSSQGLAENTGVRWNAYAGFDGSRVLSQTDSLPASMDPRLLSLEVQAPPEGFVKLVLEYERFPGTTRKEGVFRTSHFAFYPAAEADGREVGQ